MWTGDHIHVISPFISLGYSPCISIPKNEQFLYNDIFFKEKQLNQLTMKIHKAKDIFYTLNMQKKKYIVKYLKNIL